MKIAVLSADPTLYSTQRLVEAIEQRGHEAVVINHTKCFLLIEGEVPSIRYEGKSIVGLDAVIPRIGTSVTAFGCAVVRQFELMKVFTTVKSQAIGRSRGGRTTWENIVTACAPCNLRKGGRTPAQAGMPPLSRPEQPSAWRLQAHGRRFPPHYLHESWLDYLYWDIELEPWSVQ